MEMASCSSPLQINMATQEKKKRKKTRGISFWKTLPFSLLGSAQKVSLPQGPATRKLSTIDLHDLHGFRAALIIHPGTGNVLTKGTTEQETCLREIRFVIPKWDIHHCVMDGISRITHSKAKFQPWVCLKPNECPPIARKSKRGRQKTAHEGSTPERHWQIGLVGRLSGTGRTIRKSRGLKRQGTGRKTNASIGFQRFRPG